MRMSVSCVKRASCIGRGRVGERPAAEMPRHVQLCVRHTALLQGANAPLSDSADVLAATAHALYSVGKIDLITKEITTPLKVLLRNTNWLLEYKHDFEVQVVVRGFGRSWRKWLSSVHGGQSGGIKSQ